MVATIKQICYSEIEQLTDSRSCIRGEAPRKKAIMKIDLALTNDKLYNGCTTGEVAGRRNLTTPVDEAVGIVGRNIAAIVAATEDRSEVTLTGPMAVWAYLVVFHAVVHAFARVYYDDGRGNKVLVAAHG